MRSLRSTAVALLLLVLAPAARAQEVIWERVGVTGLTGPYGIGWKTVAIGDINGDGYRDLLTLAAIFTVRFLPEPQLWILSGKDGQTLRVRPGPSSSWAVFSDIADAGDVDGDGGPDYAVHYFHTGGPNPYLNVVEVRSAKDDRLIWKVTTTGGVAVQAMLGNLDLDGKGGADLVVTTFRNGKPGEVHAYSSRGQLLYKTSSATGIQVPGWNGPDTLGRVGDLDRDGLDDYVVGAWDLTNGQGAAAVLSGKTGKILVVGVDQKPGDKLGQTVDGCGDMDGDGYPDFVSGGGVFGNPSVTAFSGKTGKPIWTWRGTNPGSDLGYVVKSGGIDVDRDGVPDVIAGAPGEAWFGPANVGAAYVFSGRDGSVIFRGVSAPQSGQTDFASDIAVVGTQPGSPFPVFVVPEPRYKPVSHGYLGRLRAYRGSPGGVVGFGASCRGSLTTSPKIGMRDLGAKGARITVYDANPGSPALLLVGLSRTSFGATPLPLALDPFGFVGCKLFTSIELVLATTTGSSGLSKGYAPFDLPVSLAAAGKVTLHAQWLSTGTGKLHPGGISDAISWRMK